MKTTKTTTRKTTAIVNPAALARKLRRAGRPIKMSQQEAVATQGLNAAIDLAHATATTAGWYTNPTTGETIERNVGEVIALMHSELSEALEAWRKNLMDDKLPGRKGIEVELADCCIRIFDTSAALGLDLAGAIVSKNRYNQRRQDHKLANRRKPGGKKI